MSEMTTINPAIIPPMRSQLIGGAPAGGATGFSLTVNEPVKSLTSSE